MHNKRKKQQQVKDNEKKKKELEEQIKAVKAEEARQREIQRKGN